MNCEEKNQIKAIYLAFMRLAFPEKIAAYKRTYYQKNKEAVKKSKNKWMAKNKARYQTEEYRQHASYLQRRRYYKDIEKSREKNREYRKNNRERINLAQRKRSQCPIKKDVMNTYRMLNRLYHLDENKEEFLKKESDYRQKNRNKIIVSNRKADIKRRFSEKRKNFNKNYYYKNQYGDQYKVAMITRTLEKEISNEKKKKT